MNINFNIYETVRSIFFDVKMFIYTKIQEYQSSIPIYRLYIKNFR